MAKTILILLVIIFGAACSTQKDKLTITIDIQKRGFVMPEGDSVFVSDSRFVEDHVDSSGSIRMSSGHSVPEDTVIRLINFKPLVIIMDSDTSRYYLNQDTLRFTSCNPIHSTKQ